MPPPPDPYEVLGLRQRDRPTAGDVRKAYHKLARVHHPDKARTSDEKEAAESRFKEIGAAYELLSDPERRAEFDEHGFDPKIYQTPAEADEEERHARRMYCAAMGIPETVVREVWCTMEELFAGVTKREVIVVHVVGADSGVPTKQSKIFTVRVRPGCHDRSEIRFGAMHTNNLQSVAFVVRETPHVFFERREVSSAGEKTKNNCDVYARVALTQEQFEKGTTLTLPTLDGKFMRLRLKPGSAVVKNGGVKVIKGEGFPFPEISATYATDQNRGGEFSRGDLNVSFRVMSRLESRARFVLKAYVTLYRTRFVCRLGSWVLLGYGALWCTVRVLEWALDLDDAFLSRGRVPDAALLHNFPGAYGLLGGKENQIFYPRFRVPEQIINDWVPTGLGACAAKMGMTAEGPWAKRAGK
jgi:DnaJ homolog subfamily B member 4